MYQEPENIKRLRLFFNALTDLDKHNLIVSAAHSLKNKNNAKQKASKSYLSHNDVNKGTRGGRHSTLSAKLDNACEAYETAKEYLETLISFL